MVAQSVPASSAPASPSVEVPNSQSAAEATDGEWTYDPNEPRYCLCNQVSYGDMVACDNEDVRIYSINFFRTENFLFLVISYIFKVVIFVLT